MRITKKPTGWMMDFQHPHNLKRRIRKVLRAKTKAEAKFVAEKIYNKMLLDPYEDEEQERIDLKEAIERYKREVSPLKSKDSQRIDRLSLDALLSFCGDRVLSSLKGSDLQGVTAWMKAQGRKKLTINRRVGSIKAFLGWAYRNRWTKYDLRSEVPKVKHGIAREARRLTDVEIEKLYAEATANLKLQIRIAASLGLRRGEIVNLSWKCVDFETATLQVGGTSEFTTKSGVSRRLQIPPTLLSEFRKHRLKTRGKWLFPTLDGDGPTEALVVTRSFARARDRAGLKDVVFHDLRATAATRLAELGLGDAAIARQLGHATVSMARKYSNRIENDVLKKAVLQLEQSTSHLFADEA